ncbi:MAG TPA: ATP-binding protein, partial [bacterium]
VAHLGEVRKATARATAVTRQLLAFGRRKPADIRTLNVDEVVLESEKMLRPVLSPHISLETRAGAGDAGVLADRTQLEQVLLNLAVNARDAMPHGGKLIVLTSTTSGLGESGAQPGVRIDVRDTGEGMSEATRSRIFEPFFTTKGHVGGTGLGMAMVYNIVKQAGGTIHVESELGKGTCVSIVLPLCDPPGSSVLMAAQGISAT